MSDLTDPLDRLHGEFLRALQADPAPLSSMAVFWYEGMRFDRAPDAPRATCRGTSFLHYKEGPKQLRDVPGQTFATEQLPAKVCTRLITEAAARWDGPRTISFRYDRSNAGWEGGYAIETSAAYRDQVLSRREIDARLATALRDHWSPGVVGVTLLYGVGSWLEPGPRVKIDSDAGKPAFVDPSAAVLCEWQAFRAHVERGQWRLYYANLRQDEAGAPLAEGNTIQAQYGR